MESKGSDSNKLTQRDVEDVVEAWFSPTHHDDDASFHPHQKHDPLRAQVRARLELILAPLKSWQAPEPPDDLVARALGRISAEAADALPVDARLEAGADVRPTLRFPFLAWNEVLAIAACIVVFVGVALVGVSGARESARRIACRSHLATLHRATAQYAAAFGGWLPNAGAVPGGYWLRNVKSGVPNVPNSRHQYLLLSRNFVDNPSVFVCGARPTARPLASDQVQKFQDFPSGEQCSYDMQNMAGSMARLVQGRRIPYLSDANPLFDDLESDARATSAMNSRSHASQGQNVLFTDGSASFERTPNVGPKQDNIWQAGALTQYEGNEVASDPDDVFLVPGQRRNGK